MKVKELIEKLQQLDPEMVVVGEFESGREHVAIDIGEVYLNRNFDAKAVVISESYEDSYIKDADFREEDLIEKELPPPRPRQGLFSELMEQQLSIVMSDMLKRDTAFLVSKDNLPADAKFVEFPIHVERKDQNENS